MIAIPIPAFPVPTDETVPPFIGVIFAIAASLGFIVLVVQAVRYLRNNRDDDDTHPDDQEKK